MYTFFFLLFLLSLIILPMGLIKPAWILRREGFSRNKFGLLILGLSIILFTAAVIAAPPSQSSPNQQITKVGSSSNEKSDTQPKDNDNTQIYTPPSLSQEPVKTTQDTQTVTPTTTPISTKVITPSPTQISTPTPTITSLKTSSYSCNCAKTCTQMSSCAEAQYQLNNCGCGRRDADNDGIACDNDCQ